MNKKSGKAGTLVAPTAPKAAHEADEADVGAMAKIKAEQIKNKVGKFGTQKFKAFKAAAAKAVGSEEKKEEQKKLSWIEIELVGEDKKPISGERYRITLPDNSVAEGTLDEKGLARIEGFEKGNCKISFPDLDQDAWE
ncbi:MAG TPA: hypothetical protein VG734_03080 [Lacunisphaera sp.]|nr:hypothetical protein [Lacunisphaera sp.]